MNKGRFVLRWIRKEAQQKHFRARVKERLGYDLDVSDWADALISILTEKAEMLARPSIKTSMWRVTLAGRVVVAVFDHETLEMVTLMTEGMWAERSLSKKDSALKGTIADTPAGKVLQGLKQ